MKTKRKSIGTTASMPVGLAIGAAVSFGVTLLLTGLLAWLIHRETLESPGYGILAMILIASFLGAETAFARIRRQRVLVCCLSGAIYFGLLLSITALFFGGQYSGVGVTALLILAGCGTAVLLGLRQGRGGHKHKSLRR